MVNGIDTIKDNVKTNMAWWLQSVDALNFALYRKMSNFDLNFKNNRKICVI